jgi:hypothetical protein
MVDHQTRITMVEIVFQWRATPAEVMADSARPKDRRKLTGTAVKMHSARAYAVCDIPVGPDMPGREPLTRLIVRVAAHEMEPHYETFYAIATFNRRDANGTESEFFRTVMPRTEISERLRGLR